MLHLHLLAVVMAGSVLFERVDSCLRNVPPVDQWDGERLSDLRVAADRGEINTLTAVMSDYVFHCNGTISQWRLQWYLRSFRPEMCTVTFTFYALRPNAGNDCILTPVGSNIVTVRTVGFSGFYFIRNVDNIFNISAGERITVQAGDIVSLRGQFDRDCDNTRLWIAGTRSTNNIVYHEAFEEDEDSEELPQLNAFDSINICRYERDEESPYITAVVEPPSEATPTGIHSPETSIQESTHSELSIAAMATTVAIVTTVTRYQPQPSGAVRMTRRINFSGGRPAMAGADDSGGNMVILTSVGASVGVLLVVAAVLTAVLCVWQCSRKRISQSAPEKPPHFAVVENEAYGVHTKHLPQQQHVRNGKASGLAPGRPQQFVMEENEAYKVHTHHSHETDLNEYYDPVDYKEEEGNDYVVKEPVYDLPS